MRKIILLIAFSAILISCGVVPTVSMRPQKSSWATNEKLNKVFIIENNSISEKFATNFMLELRTNFSQRQIENTGVIYNEKELDARKNLENKILSYNPLYLLEVNHTQTIYHQNSKGGGYYEYIFDIICNDTTNKAIIWRSSANLIGLGGSGVLARRIADKLEKDNLVNPIIKPTKK